MSLPAIESDATLNDGDVGGPNGKAPSVDGDSALEENELFPEKGAPGDVDATDANAAGAAISDDPTVVVVPPTAPDATKGPATVTGAQVPLKLKASVSADAKPRVAGGAATRTSTATRPGTTSTTARPAITTAARSTTAPRTSLAPTSKPPTSASTTSTARRTMGASTTTAPSAKPSGIAATGNRSAVLAASTAPSSSATRRPTSSTTPTPSTTTSTRGRQSTVPAASTAPTRAPLRTSAATNKPVTSTSVAEDGKSITRASPTPSTVNGGGGDSNPGATRKPVSTVSGGALKPSSAASRTTATPSTTRGHASRPSISTATTAVQGRTGPTPTPVSARDPKASEELEAKFKEVTSDLAAKSEQIAALEMELASLKESLDASTAKAIAHNQEIAKLEVSIKEGDLTKEKLEAEVVALKAAAKDAEALSAAYARLQEDLTKTQSEHVSATSRIAELVEQQATISASLEAAKSALASATSTHSETESALREASNRDQAAVISGKEALSRITAQFEMLQVENAAASLAANEKLVELQARLDAALSAESNSNAQNEALSREKDTLAAQVSELEVEVLEAQDAASKAADDAEKAIQALKARHWEEKDALTKSLQEDLRVAILRHEEAIQVWEDTSAAMDEVHTSEKESAMAQIQQASDEATKVALDALAAEHAAALAAKEAMHCDEVESLKKAHVDAQQSSREVIEGLGGELQAQRSNYETQIRTIHAEHESRIQMAFESAKAEVGAAHAKELAAFRSQSTSMLDQLRSSHENELVELKALHASSLDEHTTPLRKNIRQLTLELTATQEDLNKSKAALAASHTEIASLRKQLVEAREAIELALANTNSASEAQLTKARHDLSSANETLETYKRILAESQETLTADMEAIKSAHKREVDELIGTHSEAVNAMKHAHKDALAKVAAERESLQSRFEDERDAKEKALAQVAASARTPASPRPSANTTGVSKEELEKMHQAHNAMTIELEAEHAKAVQVLKDELEAKQHALETAEADASRKELEINFMMSEKEELDGELQRLKEEVTRHEEELSALKTLAS